MRPIYRSVLGLGAGAVVAFVLIFVVEMLSAVLYPPPADMDKSNPDALKAHVATLPAAAFVIVLAAYAIGTFGGSVVAALIAGRAHLTHALLLGGLLLVLGIVNFVLVPHPAWVVAASVVVYPVAAFLGGTLAARRQRAG